MRRLVGVAAVVLVGVAGLAPSSNASDHIDPPSVENDAAADLGDLYAWTAGDRLVVALTYAGGLVPGEEPVYDPDVLYSIWFDVDDDSIADRVIRMRFGQNPMTNQWGVQVRNVPGATADVVGPVEEELTSGTAQAWAGMADDPFFFDAEGLSMSTQMGQLLFDENRDAFAGLNTMAIVLEMDSAPLSVPGEPLAVWATAGRAM